MSSLIESSPTLSVLDFRSVIANPMEKNRTEQKGKGLYGWFRGKCQMLSGDGKLQAHDFSTYINCASLFKRKDNQVKFYYSTS